MNKKNSLSEKQLKYYKEYYKNPYTVFEIVNNLESVEPSFLGFSNNVNSGFPKPPVYLQEYQNNHSYYDKFYLKNKYGNLIINWQFTQDIKASVYTKTPEYISGKIEFNFPYWYKVCNAVIMSNDYKYSKLWSTIDINYDVLENLSLHKEETVTETFGLQKNTLEEVHGKQTQSTTNSIGSNTVKTDYGKQTSTATTQPVTTTTTNPATHSTTINKSTTYDSETSYLKDSTEVTTDTNTVQVSTGLQTDTASTDAYIDTVTNGAREDSSNVSRETFTDTTTDTKDGYTNSRTVTSYEHGDASVRAVADVLKQERQLAYINLLDIIFEDIINVLCDYYVQ